MRVSVSALVSVATLLAAVCGCGRRQVDVACEVVAPPGPITSTRVFWVRALRVPLAMGRTPVAGLDIDGEVSDGRGRECPASVADHTSSLGDGEGVDNALATFARTIEMNWSPPGTFAEELDGAMSRGAMRLVVVLDQDGADTCGNPVMSVRLRPVARLDAMPIVLDARAVPVGEVIARGLGVVLEGRLVAELAGTRVLPIDPASVRAPIGALAILEPGAIAFDVGASELTRGVIAGSWSREALAPELAASFSTDPGEAAAIVELLLDVAADLGPLSARGGCSRVSAGLEIEATEITIGE